jgi:hypothetical protein
VFGEIADEAGIPETAPTGGPHLRLLRYLEFDRPPSSMARFSNQIEGCLELGWAENQIWRRILKDTPSSIA